jgi:hypothetical protein
VLRAGKIAAKQKFQELIADEYGLGAGANIRHGMLRNGDCRDCDSNAGVAVLRAHAMETSAIPRPNERQRASHLRVSG